MTFEDPQTDSIPDRRRCDGGGVGIRAVCGRAECGAVLFKVFCESSFFCFCESSLLRTKHLLKTQGLKQTRRGVGGRRIALLLRLGLYTPPSSRTASSGRFVLLHIHIRPIPSQRAGEGVMFARFQFFPVADRSRPVTATKRVAWCHASSLNLYNL